MSRADWAALSLRIFERIIWFQSLYFGVAALQKCRAVYQEFGLFGLQWFAVDVMGILLSALALQGIAWYLRAHANVLVDLSPHGAAELAGHDRRDEDPTESNRAVEAKPAQSGAEPMIAAFFVFGACWLVPAMEEMISESRWYLLPPEYSAGQDAWDERTLALVHRVIPSAIELTLALVLIVFARPLAIRLTRETPADEIEAEIVR